MEGKPSNEPAESLVIRLFGPFDVRLGGRPLPRLRSHKEQWLLALLVLRAARPVERDWLAGTLWPESDASQAAYNLRRSLSNLRQTLGEQASRLLSPSSHAVRLDLSGAEVDLIAFDRAIAQEDAAALEAAIALYRGPLLEGCLEEWVFPERQVREQAYLGALEKRALLSLKQGDPETAVTCLKRAVSVDSLRQSAQRALMQALAAGGNSSEAILVFRDFRLLLRQELNADPDPETVALFQRIRAEARDPRPLAPPPAPLAVVRTVAPARPVGCLPSPITSLVGREQEIAEIGAHLQSARLVTLTGMGGVGKTRLAIEAARQTGAEYADGVWFVDLAPLSDPALLAQAVAATFELPEEGERTLEETLLDHLHRQQSLLVMDNCEHLIAACARLADSLLRFCSRLRLLATSRQPLGLIGEVVFRVPVLALPPRPDASPPARELARPGPEAQDGLALVMQYEAPRLFEERARQALPAFRITHDNAGTVGQICHHLDGIPLAIELAAARVKALSVEQIAARLGDRFQLLTEGSRTALPRQQTLRDLIAWSYNLLTPKEQALLRRLVVFAGGWTLEAAEVVGAGNGIEADEVLDLLSGLVEKSLVVYEQEGEARYRLLETVSQYAWEQLMESGEEAQARRRHLLFCVDLAEEAEGNLFGSEPARWLTRLEREHGNLRAALALDILDDADLEVGLRLAGALRKYWEIRGHLSEGRAHLGRLLARSPTSAPRSAARARALYGAAALALRQGDREAARALFEKCLSIQRALGNLRETAYTLNALGTVAMQQGDDLVARSLLSQSLAIQRELGDRRGIAYALNNLGLGHYKQGDYNQARLLYEECLAINRELGDRMGIANVLDNLGNVAYEQGDITAAQELYEQGHALHLELGHRRGIADTLFHLGKLAYHQGDYETAWRAYNESLEIRQDLGDKPMIALSLRVMGELVLARGDCQGAEQLLAESLRLYGRIGHPRAAVEALAVFARVRAAQEQWELAACLIGAIEALRENMETPLSPSDHARYQECAAAVRASLGKTAFAAASAQGKTLSLEAAIDRTLAAGAVS
ncbi:MAG TPA: tetratricopeptide repeat protein [Chthonomonadaceae bacterium]|nr:tetratricopeptide repeat protein [Chthonomonadaceae bacterium]